MTLNPAIRAQIESIIASDNVVLFMKGNRERPQCGFSAKVVDMLDGLLPEYATFDVLSHPDIREGIKEFTKWPTIPQLYINKEFVGGCDIVTQMFQDGSLQKMLGLDDVKAEVPAVTVSEAAVQAFKAALAGSDEGETIRMSINARFEHAMEFDTARPNDLVVEQHGLRILFDPMSARRAQGLSIDYTESALGKGFKMNNPQAG